MYESPPSNPQRHGRMPRGWWAPGFPGSRWLIGAAGMAYLRHLACPALVCVGRRPASRSSGSSGDPSLAPAIQTAPGSTTAGDRRASARQRQLAGMALLFSACYLLTIYTHDGGGLRERSPSEPVRLLACSALGPLVWPGGFTCREEGSSRPTCAGGPNQIQVEALHNGAVLGGGYVAFTKAAALPPPLSKLGH